MRGVRVALSLLAILTMAACRPGPQKEPVVYRPPTRGAYGAEPENPDSALAEQLRSGAVQAAAAAATVQEALDQARVVAAEAPSELREAAQTIADLLDDAGATLTSAGAKPPGVDTVKADFASADDERKERIAQSNDALRSLEEAFGTCDSLSSENLAFDDLAELIQLAIEDTRDAVKAFGGQVAGETDN